jgi:hypothetical protein
MSCTYVTRRATRAYHAKLLNELEPRRAGPEAEARSRIHINKSDIRPLTTRRAAPAIQLGRQVGVTGAYDVAGAI